MRKEHYKRSFMYLALLLSSVFILQSCFDADKFKLDKLDPSTSLSPTIALTIGTTTLKISDFLEPIPDTLSFEADSTIMISFSQDSMAGFVLADMFEMPDLPGTSISQTIGTQSIGAIETLEKEITLEQLTNNMGITNSQFNTMVALSGGGFPAIDQLSAGTFPSENSISTFVSATFESGELSVAVTNKLNTKMTNLELGLANFDTNGEFVDYVDILTYASILPGQTITRKTDLAGKTLMADLRAEFKSFSTPGSPTAPDLQADKIAFAISSNDLVVASGEAQIPIGTPALADNMEIPVDLDGMEIHEIVIKSGTLDFTIESNIQFDMELALTLPNFSGITVNPIAISNTGGTPKIESIDLAGAVLDISTGKINVTYNLPMPEGEMIKFDKDDFVNIDVAINNFDFESVSGYFGVETIAIDEEIIPMDFELDGFEGDIKLIKPSISLNITNNSVGIPITFDFDLSRADINKTATISQTLSKPAMNQTVISTITLDNTTQNLTDIMSIPLGDITYSGTVKVGDPADKNCFVTSESSAKVGMSVDIPFAISASDVLYVDTFNIENPDDIPLTYVQAILDIENELPFNLGLKFKFYDSVSDVVVDSLDLSGFIQSAVIDPTTGRVTAPASYQTDITFTEANLESMKISDMVLVEISLDTKGDNPAADDPALGVYIEHTAELKMGVRIILKTEIDPSDFLGGSN